eukprot:TRINITY_DN66970_c9_g1_i1.p1 TRINITY_DN66970_c9_g1~~TRINITY_DN66970_c9_g1_i1.p1  ORF type:complete len:177 (-),score=9.20 TRINITY_DN66970_c9_g1_i1:299-829(-)
MIFFESFKFTVALGLLVLALTIKAQCPIGKKRCGSGSDATCINSDYDCCDSDSIGGGRVVVEFCREGYHCCFGDDLCCADDTTAAGVIGGVIAAVLGLCCCIAIIVGIFVAIRWAAGQGGRRGRGGYEYNNHYPQQGGSPYAPYNQPQPYVYGTPVQPQPGGYVQPPSSPTVGGAF